MLPLRPYQQEALDKIAGSRGPGRAAHDRLAHATGTGKPPTAAHLVKQRPGRAMVLCHRDELITQAAGKIAVIAPELAGIVKAEMDQRDEDVVIASVQSLHERRLARFPLDFATVIVDEAHHSISTTWRHAMWYLRCFEDPGPLTVGFTATPGRGDGRALSAVWQEIVHEFSLLSGIVGGYLCDVRGQIAGTSMDRRTCARWPVTTRHPGWPGRWSCPRRSRRSRTPGSSTGRAARRWRSPRTWRPRTSWPPRCASAGWRPRRPTAAPTPGYAGTSWPGSSVGNAGGRELRPVDRGL